MNLNKEWFVLCPEELARSEKQGISSGLLFRSLEEAMREVDKVLGRPWAYYWIHDETEPPEQVNCPTQEERRMAEEDFLREIRDL
jgi:hypothetical protein